MNRDASNPWAHNPDTVEAQLRPPDPEVAAIASKIDQIAQNLLQDRNAQRRCMPDVAMKVMRSIGADTATGASLEKLLSGDPFLTGQVLSLANSAFFGSGHNIVSVRNAVMRVGMAAVRDLVMLALTQSTMFRIRGFDAQAETLRRRSLLTAVAARSIGQAVGKHSDFAFLCGLLHDIGHLVVLERASKVGVLTPTIIKNPQLLTVVLQGCANHHKQVGAAVCRAWRLPELVAHSCEHHHAFQEEAHYCIPGHLAAVADLVADHLGAGVSAVPLEMEHPWCKGLGLTAQKVQRVVAETEAQFPSLLAATGVSSGRK